MAGVGGVGDAVLPVDDLPTVGFSSDSIVAVGAHVKRVNLAGGPDDGGRHILAGRLCDSQSLSPQGRS